MLQQILARGSESGTTPESRPAESPHDRYTQAVRGLIADAYQQKTVQYLVNALTWGLAGVAHDYGPGCYWRHPRAARKPPPVDCGKPSCTTRSRGCQAEGGKASVT